MNYRLRIDALPVLSGETYQVGVLRAPTWVHDEEGEAPLFRPVVFVCASATSGLMHTSPPCHPGEITAESALETVLEFAESSELGDGLPERILSAGGAFTETLAGALGPAGVEIAAETHLEELERIRAFFYEQAEGPARPGPLAEGVELEQLRSFVEAVELFVDSAPWVLFSEGDLLSLKRPVPPPDMQRVLLLGRAGDALGLAFFASTNEYDAFHSAAAGEPGGGPPRWSLFLNPLEELPFADSDLYLDGWLPTPESGLYPLAIGIDPESSSYRRPDPAQLATFEAVLRATVGLRRAELRTGSWSRLAGVQGRSTRIEMTLPWLAEEPMPALPELPAKPPRPLAPGGESDHDAWRDVHIANHAVFEAEWADGLVQEKLARHALTLDPYNADAWRILTGHTDGEDEVLELYGKSLRAGEHAVVRYGATFLHPPLPSWGDVFGAPYLRALCSAGHAFVALGETQRAREVLGRYLAHGLYDAFDARVGLILAWLIDENPGAAEEVYQAVTSTRKKKNPAYAYLGALIRFTTDGPSSAAKRRRTAALRRNVHVAELLLDRVEPARFADDEELESGSLEEASLFTASLYPIWVMTDGALDFLEDGL